MIDKQEFLLDHIESENRVKEFMKDFSLVKQLEDHNLRLSKSNQVLTKENLYRDYLIKIEEHVCDKYKHLAELHLTKLEAAEKSIELLQNQQFFKRTVKESLENEDKQRNSTNQYISLLENEIANLNGFLERMRLHNPNLSAWFKFMPNH